MMNRSRKDFPTPAAPVRKTLSPEITRLAAAACSALSALQGMGIGAAHRDSSDACCGIC